MGAEPARAKRVQDNLHAHAQNETKQKPRCSRQCVAQCLFQLALLKTHFLWRWHCGKKHKNVKIEIWFITVCTLIGNEYASLLFSQTFFSYCFSMLSEFAKVFERKVWRVQAVICIMKRVHFQVRVGVFNSQQILAKISFVIFDIVVKNKSSVV